MKKGPRPYSVEASPPSFPVLSKKGAFARKHKAAILLPIYRPLLESHHSERHQSKSQGTLPVLVLVPRR